MFAATLMSPTLTDREMRLAARTFTLADTRPFASFTLTCSGLTCAFDASASSDSDGFISSYAWNFGDTPTSIGNSRQATYQYRAGGTYTITLTVTDNTNQTVLSAGW